MEKDLTNEEMEVIRLYKTFTKNAINIMLTSNVEKDFDVMSKQKDNNLYSKMNLIKNIETFKSVYAIILKMFYKKIEKKDWSFSKYTTLAEVNKAKNEIYIDRLIFATAHKEKNEEEQTENIELPVLVNLIGDKNIPYIELEKILGTVKAEEEVLISPFTKIKKIEEVGKKDLDEDKNLKIYNMYLEKQELVKMSKEEKTGLYTYLVTNADLVN